MYDAEGLRAEMEENGRISKFVFDGKNVVAEETNEDVIRYIRGDRLVASDSEHARRYYHYVGDELGSVTHVTDENGIVLNCYAYDAFGNCTVSEEKIANRFGYAGEQYDEITQQYYLRARFYNPVIGRFMQEDTYYGDRLNLYEYGRNNPVRYIDPGGHEVRAAAEKNYVNRAVDAMNGAVDQGVDGMLERVYGDKGDISTYGSYSTKIDEKVTVIDKQELPNSLVKTFKDGNYRTVVTNEDITVYRSFGYNAEAGGAFATSNQALNRTQTKVDSAILPEWKNTLRYEAEIIVPKSNILNIGRVEEQFTMSGTKLTGDADQFLLPQNWNLNWINSIREVRP